MPVTCAFTYDQLLSYTEGETARWREWFDAHPDALDVQFGEGRLATVRGVILHTFAVELRYTERLVGKQEPVTSYDQLRGDTLEALFAIGDRARAMLRDYLRTMTEEDAHVVLTFPTLTAGTLTASKYKIASNIFLHAIRHWAQVASTLRAAGYRDQWGHDMLLSPLEM
jgi:uncharacterized damage-inducible protein DinB